MLDMIHPFDSTNTHTHNHVRCHRWNALKNNNENISSATRTVFTLIISNKGRKLTLQSTKKCNIEPIYSSHIKAETWSWKQKNRNRETLHGRMKETGSSGSFGISSHSVSHGFIQVLSVMCVTQTAVVILLFGTEVEAVTLHHHHPHWFAVTPMCHLMLDICTETQRLHRKHSNRDLKPANMSRDTRVSEILFHLFAPFWLLVQPAFTALHHINKVCERFLLVDWNIPEVTAHSLEKKQKSTLPTQALSEFCVHCWMLDSHWLTDLKVCSCCQGNHIQYFTEIALVCSLH